LGMRDVPRLSEKARLRSVHGKLKEIEE
jgi:hypothetical protein